MLFSLICIIREMVCSRIPIIDIMFCNMLYTSFFFYEIPNPKGCQTYRVNSNIFMKKAPVCAFILSLY